jgi:hypothetical protein
MLLQTPDLLADGAGRQVQFPRREQKALPPGRDFEDS